MPIRDESIAGVGPLEHTGELERVRQFHRHVLERMHRQLGATVEQREFEFLGEQAFAADVGERPILDLVATSGHADERDRTLRITGLQETRDMVRLPEGKAAFAGGDPEPMWRRRLRLRGGRRRSVTPDQLTRPLTIDHCRRLTGSRSGISRSTTCQ